jgi:hypothetical protein
MIGLLLLEKLQHLDFLLSRYAPGSTTPAARLGSWHIRGRLGRRLPGNLLPADTRRDQNGGYQR